ncbi:MAG: carboxypeptidase regulatory-like domain-containing protein [Pirellulaceae bacterium]
MADPKTPTAAMGIGVHRRHTLLGRLRRVLLPGEQPEVHISPASLLMLLVLAGLGMALVWQGTTVAVAVAAEIVSPAERVKRVAEQVEDHAPLVEGNEPVTFSGTIRTEAGSPLPKKMWGTRRTKSKNYGEVVALGEMDAEFSLQCRPGLTWLVVHSEEYAVGVAGPFDGRSGKSFDAIEIVLTKGFPAKFTVQNEDGKPVAGATVSAGYIVGGGSSDSQKAESNAQGEGILAHALEGEYFISAKAPGYQDTGSTRMKVEKGKKLEIEVRRAQPVTGQVVTTDGTPIAGAVLQEFVTLSNMSNSEGNHIHGPYGDKLATTDEEGRFTLDQLVSDMVYYLLVSHPEHGKRVHEGVRPGQQGLKMVLGPGFTLEGTLEGDLSKLPQRRGEPYIRVRQEVPVGPEKTRGWSSSEATVERTETGGKFTLKGLLPAETTITAGEHKATIDLTEPRSQVTIDLNDTVPVIQTRQVELTFEADKSALPRGSVRVYSPGFRNGELSDLPIVDGRVELEVTVGADLYVRPKGIIGYWFKERHFPVEAGDQPHTVRLETFPAGAISGQALLASGKPDTEIQVSIRAIDKPEEFKLQTITHSSSQRVDSQGGFVFTPLPLGAKYVVIAGKGHNKTVSDPVELTETEPTGDVQLSLSPDASASGTVVGPSGKPLADIPLQLELTHSLASTSWGPGFTSDRNGRFQFDGLSSTLEGYEVRLATNKDYQPQSIPLKPGGPPVTMKLEKGHVLECAVLDAETGRPIPGVELYAYPLNRQADEPYAYEAEGKTVADGTTRFSNLAGREFQINDRNGLTWDKEKGKLDIPSQNIPLVIEATLPEWSRLELGP